MFRCYPPPPQASLPGAASTAPGALKLDNYTLDKALIIIIIIIIINILIVIIQLHITTTTTNNNNNNNIYNVDKLDKLDNYNPISTR